MAPQGAVFFWGRKLHPSSALIVWLLAVVGVQYAGYAALGVLILIALVSSRKVLGVWLKYVSRARWLLLTLWLILSYSTAGEAIRDFSWAPTYQGVAEANLQAVRLLSILACLAWLMVRLGRDGLVSAIWGLLRPLEWLWGNSNRLVVRLSLVLDNLQSPQERGSWRKILAGSEMAPDGPELLHLSITPWMYRDTLIVVAMLAMLLGVVFL